MPRTFTGKEARQGRNGKRVLMILVISCLLIAIGWLGVELYGEYIAPNAEQGQTYSG